MKYQDGMEVRTGDKVKLSEGHYGVVVFSIDTDEYSPEYPKKEWSYLKKGVMINSEQIGLVHYEEPDEDMVLVERPEQN